MKIENYNLPYEYDTMMESSKWFNEIPFIQFPENWQIKITPPFGGAVVRFRVKEVGKEKEVSVYLDCYDRIGCVGQPYWEVYPYQDDVFRCYMNETNELLSAIKEALQKN